MLSNRELREMREAGKELMPDVCNILSETRTSDGQGGVVSSWGTLTKNVPCRMDQMVGSERATDGSLRAFTSYEMSMPYDTVITEAYRVEFNGEQYHVTNANAAQSWQIEKVVLLEKLS